MSNLPSAPKNSHARKEQTFWRQTLITSFVSIASVLIGVFGSGWLTERDKRQELDVAASRRAIDSVEGITSLIFERDARAELIASSIRRSAPVEELKDRKKQYDEVYIRFNSNLQSNLFNLRDGFHSKNYKLFEDLLMTSLQDIFISEDRCITAAYDVAMKPTTTGTAQRVTDADPRLDALQHCVGKKTGEPVAFDAIHSAILLCEYTFSDNLFKVVTSPTGLDDTVLASRDEIAKACVSPTSTRLLKQAAATTISTN